MKPDRRHFTEAARAAAAVARAKKAALKAATKNDLEIFVLRRAADDQSYSWQIRKFGGVILFEAEMAYATPAEARRGAVDALANIGRAAPDSDVHALVASARMQAYHFDFWRLDGAAINGPGVRGGGAARRVARPSR